MWQRIVAVLVMLGVVVGVIAVASKGSSPSHDAASLPKLPLASANAERTGATKDATAAAPATSAMLAPIGLDVTVAGTLPDLGTTAAAYEFTAQPTADAVAKLASALAVSGDVSDIEGAFVVNGTENVLRVEKAAPAFWSMYPAAATRDNCTTSSDGTTTCQGSGSTSTASPAIGCAVPPCPPNSTCPAPDVKCSPGSTTTTTRPADLPTKDEAEQQASTLFSKAGMSLDGARLETTEGDATWVVTLQPAVGGKSVSGLTATAVIGSKGKVASASGWLGTPKKLGDYPLVSAAAALDRLKNGQYVSSGVGPLRADAVAKATTAVSSAPAPELTPEEARKIAPVTGSAGPATAGSSGSASGSGGAATPSTAVAPVPMPMPVPPAKRQVTATGAHLELAVVARGNGTAVLVPVVAFETSDGSTLPLVAAVPDAFLEQQTTPTTGKGVPVPATEPAVAPTATSGSEVLPVEPAPAKP
jgi:hypothetical protein